MKKWWNDFRGSNGYWLFACVTMVCAIMGPLFYVAFLNEARWETEGWVQDSLETKQTLDKFKDMRLNEELTIDWRIH